MKIKDILKREMKFKSLKCEKEEEMGEYLNPSVVIIWVWILHLPWDAGQAT